MFSMLSEKPWSLSWASCGVTGVDAVASLLLPAPVLITSGSRKESFFLGRSCPLVEGTAPVRDSVLTGGLNCCCCWGGRTALFDAGKWLVKIDTGGGWGIGSSTVVVIAWFEWWCRCEWCKDGLAGAGWDVELIQLSERSRNLCLSIFICAANNLELYL